MEINFCERFFKIIKKEKPPCMFSGSRNFLELHAFANNFKVRTNRGNKRHCKKRKQVRYFNIINLLSADTKLAVVLRVPSSKEFEGINSPLLNFPRWLYLAPMQFDMSL